MKLLKLVNKPGFRRLNLLKPCAFQSARCKSGSKVVAHPPGLHKRSSELLAGILRSCSNLSHKREV